LIIKPCMGQISRTFYVNIEGKVWLLFKKYWLEKTDRVTKTSLFDRTWAISLKPSRKSRPPRLVWWALIKPNTPQTVKHMNLPSHRNWLHQTTIWLQQHSPHFHFNEIYLNNAPITVSYCHVIINHYTF
jgi:hypothetical protein